MTGRQGSGVGPALLATAVLALVGAVVAGLTSGAPAVRGVVVGACLVAVLFAVGSLVVQAVATLSPALSLLVALLTYLLQLLLMVIALTALERSGVLGPTLDRVWTGGTIIAGTLLWSAALVHAATRRTAHYHSETEGRESGDSAEVSDGPGAGTAR
jgi:ATP synthase protein I